MDKPVEELSLQEGERLQFFSESELEYVKFANILKDIVMEYIRSRKKLGGTNL